MFFTKKKAQFFSLTTRVPISLQNKCLEELARVRSSVLTLVAKQGIAFSDYPYLGKQSNRSNNSMFQTL